MAKDKYSAVWVSHSSMSDFLRCPRAYYLRHIYKDPKTGRKITRMQPPLALGQIIHEVIESLSILPVEERLKIPLSEKFEKAWEKVSGKKGGFRSKEEEEEYKARGRKMLQVIEKNPGPILNKAVKISSDLPFYWLSEEENIILCGKIDWLEYLEGDDSIHIIDFKTGKREESEDSLQLPIYHLLATNTQKRKVGKVSYWYLDRDKEPISMELPDLNEAYGKVMETAKRMKLGRQINHLKCPQEGCFACRSLEAIKDGKGELVGLSQYKQDIYILND